MNPILKSSLFFVGLLGASCTSIPPPGADCGAEAMQPLVGRDAVDIVDLIKSQPRYVRNNAYYFGNREPMPPDISNNALIIEVNASYVNKPTDLLGAHVTRIYCIER